MYKSRLSKEEIDICVSNFFQPYVPFEIEDTECGYEELIRYNPKDIYKCETFMEIASCIPTPNVKGIYNNVYSWIAPNGDYYSTDFPTHEKKASLIICGNKDLFYTYIKLFSTRSIALGVLGTMSSINGETPVPSDFLVQNKNWCRFGSPQFESPKPIIADTNRLTKYQIATIYDLSYFYKLKKDPISQKNLNWNNL